MLEQYIIANYWTLLDWPRIMQECKAERYNTSFCTAITSRVVIVMPW